MAKVTHHLYGKGEIEAKRCGGFEFLIRFENNILRWVRYDELVLREAENLVEEKISKPQITLPSDNFKARQVIESLRLGIVPFSAIKNFTIGRNKEIKQINQWLNNKKSGTLMISGEYGSGKTHLLEYVRMNALNENWAVAMVEVGLEESPFYKPYLIYRQIVRNFEVIFNDEKLNFQSYLETAIQKDTSGEIDTHLYLGKIKKLMELAADDSNSLEQLWEWIEGVYDWFKPKLYKMGTAANIYCYLINGISWIAKNIFGLKGFLILFDEAEFINDSDYFYQMSKGKNFLKGLTALAQNKTFLLDEKIGILKYGRKSGLQYCGVPRNDPIRFAWQFPSSLKLLFAITPTDEYLKNAIELLPLKKEYFHIISELIFQYYEIAYQTKIENINPKIVLSKIKVSQIRLLIKQIIEILDILRFNPEKNFGDI